MKIQDQKGACPYLAYMHALSWPTPLPGAAGSAIKDHTEICHGDVKTAAIIQSVIDSLDFDQHPLVSTVRALESKKWTALLYPEGAHHPHYSVGMLKGGARLTVTIDGGIVPDDFEWFGTPEPTLPQARVRVRERSGSSDGSAQMPC